jgi:hypothetical protein
MRRAGPCAGERSNALGNGRVDPEQMLQAPCHRPQKARRTVACRARIRTRKATSPRGGRGQARRCAPHMQAGVLPPTVSLGNNAILETLELREDNLANSCWRFVSRAEVGSQLVWPPLPTGVDSIPQNSSPVSGGAAHGHRSEQRCTDRF